MSRRRLLLLVVMLAAFALRVWGLAATPPGLWYDEAYNALDARWIAESGRYPLFFVGNNGREPMWHYLLLLSTSLLGNTPFAARWQGAIIGWLTLPIFYRLARTLLRGFSLGKGQAAWLGVVATGWLAGSWWHLLNSRAGFRPILLPPLLMLSLYFLWQGRQAALRDGARPAGLVNFGLAGLFLGLSQYTYLPARLAPLIFAGLFLAWSGQILFKRQRFSILGRLWGGGLVSGLVATLTFLPLGLYFLQNPDVFSARTGDVLFAPDRLAETLTHLAQGLTLFLGAGHELYRHHLPGRAMLGWLEIPFFWLGLFFLLRPASLRRPATPLILIGLVVMWLPALLASPPVHALRPIGLLSFFYLIVSLGLDYAGRLQRSLPSYGLPLAFSLILSLNFLINGYDYFQRWAKQPEVYQEYNGPLLDLTGQLLTLSEGYDVLIPFHLYVHPTTRFLLRSYFPEVTSGRPKLTRPRQFVLLPQPFPLLYVGNIPESTALVLLTRSASGPGAAYVSRPPRAEEQTALKALLADSTAHPFTDRLGRDLAFFLPLAEAEPLLTALFDPTPLRTVDLNWANLARLTGYELTPNPAQPGQPLTLTLYWQSLTDKTFDHKLFLQIIDTAGNPYNQWESDAFREDMYRWRPTGLLPTQHTLWLGPDMPPGPYLIRLGFFDKQSGQRLPLYRPGRPALDQVQLGLFYVSAAGPDPGQPASPLSADFGGVISLTGVSLPPLPPVSPAALPISLTWQARQPTAQPYTLFLQLLAENGQVVSGWDRQPFNGLYPTDLWSPAETLTDTFLLPLPEAGLPPGPYRLITGFYDGTTGQRLPVVTGGDFVVIAEFALE